MELSPCGELLVALHKLHLYETVLEIEMAHSEKNCA